MMTKATATGFTPQTIKDKVQAIQAQIQAIQAKLAAMETKWLDI